MIAMLMRQTDQETNTAAEGTALELEPAEDAGEGAERGDGSPVSTILIGVGIVIVMMMIFRMLKSSTRTQRSRDYQNETARETIDRHRVQAVSAREPLNTMMAEADELARRLAKTLDNKAARLDALIAEANDRIAVLERLQARAGGSPALPRLGEPARISPGSIEEQIFALADDGCDSMQIAGRIGRSVGEVDLILALRR